MKCPRCDAENREGRRFCAECGAALPAACPACGFANEPGEKFCGGCGEKLSAPAPARAGAAPVAASPAPPAAPVAPAPSTTASASPDTYTPKHLAARILSSKSALEGERKQVTVLFADIKGSMEVIANRDPEEARRLLDAVLERMMDAVHRYEGTVNQVLGDGIMALFGAPLAIEEHAVRACYAALAMQESIRRYAQEQAADGPPVQIRTGLNSGEVVVRAIGNDLHMDYSAIGPTVHLAARMEQTAVPGTILVTAETVRLAEGYVEVRSLGPTPIKGLAEPVAVFELVGADSLRTRLQVSAARGLTPFVGRRAELEALPRALTLAGAGLGQVVALVGEAGMGKSRLLWEFTRSPWTAGWLILECRSISYGKATTYLPVIELLKYYFHVGDRDGVAEIRDKVVGRVRALDPALEPLLPPLLALLDVPVADAEWAGLDPLRRRQRTLDAVRRLVLRECQVQPVILVFEDLHWIDSETQALLDSLVETLPSARLLLLVNYRPDYQHGWGGLGCYTQLRLDPLASESAEDFLKALLGDDPEQAPLRRHLIERTEGNPFFLEESVRSLAETGVLTGERGRYTLVKPLSSVEVPASVQAILAARIDRLAPEGKRLLQCASVVGRDVPLTLLQTIAGVPEAELREGLAGLRAAEFLYEASLFPEVEYSFTHALTHDVAYASLLHERRRALHGQMVEGIEQLYADRLEVQVERLAHHAFRAEQWPKAVAYQRQAGKKALTRSAHTEAVTSFEQALAALAHLPETPETLAQAVDLRFDLRNALWPLGRLDKLLEHVQQAQVLAERLGDDRRLGQVSAYMSQFFAWMGDHERALESGLRTRRIAADLGDLGLEVGANFRLGQAYYARGDYREGVDVLTQNAGLLVGERERERFGLTALPSVLSRAWLAWCLAELGDFGEGDVHATEALKIAEAVDLPIDVVIACFANGILGLRKGDVEPAISVLERALGLCERGHVLFWLPLVSACLGAAYALSGRAAEAVPLLARAVKEHADMRLMGVHSLFVAWHGEAQLLAGQLAEAAASADEALALALRHREGGHEAWSRWLVGEVAAHPGRDDLTAAEAAYRQSLAIADARGMRPLAARCRFGLGRVHGRRGDRDATREWLTAAVTAFRDLDMALWLAPAKQELDATR
jgi:class 3 adenylate cyclase/tetratricopeptide (TPR) repeat protein